MNKTPPFTPGRKITRSRLSRKNFSQLQQNKELNGQNSPTTPQRSNNSYSPGTQDKLSPKYFPLSQDPSREIVWEMRPLSPLTQSAKNDDFMTNLCNSWKTIEKASSPVGTDSLSKLWKKPQSTPIKSHGQRNLRSSKKSNFEEEFSDIPISNETLELQKISRLLRSKSHSIKGDLKSNQSKSTDSHVEKEQDFQKQNVTIKDVSNTTVKKKSNILNQSHDIFSDDEVIAPDSLEIIKAEDDLIGDEDLWGDEDESLIRGLSQAGIPDLDAAFIDGSQITTIPSTLSCENLEKSKFAVGTYQPLHEVTLNPHKHQKTQSLKKSVACRPLNFIKPKQVSQSEDLSNINKISLTNDKNIPLIDISDDTESVGTEDFPSQVTNKSAKHNNCSKTNATKKELSDEILFSDDDFLLSQEILLMLDQGGNSATVDKPKSDPEPSLSQKRRATADEIARKREEALKVRKFKKKSDNSIHKKSFIRTNSSTMR